MMIAHNIIYFFLSANHSSNVFRLCVGAVKAANEIFTLRSEGGVVIWGVDGFEEDVEIVSLFVTD